MFLRSLIWIFLSSALLAQSVPASQQDLFSKPALDHAAKSDGWEESTVRSDIWNADEDHWKPPSKSLVPKDAPVITLKGLCTDEPADSPDCKTVVTRQQFESLVTAVFPKLAPGGGVSVADQYVDVLSRATRTRELGFAETEQYKIATNFNMMNSMATLLNDYIMDKAKQLTEADIDEFYRENPRLFEEIKTERIVIPHYTAFPIGKTHPTPEQIAESSVKMKKEAESIRARAVLPGADFQVLENEGWKSSGYSDEAPTVAQSPLLRWEIWPRTRVFIFDLKVGEISPVIDEPTNGLYIYKILAKRQVPLDEARTYIRKRYVNVRYEDAVARLLDTIKFSVNKEYFSDTGASGGLRGSGKSTFPSKVPGQVPDAQSPQPGSFKDPVGPPMPVKIPKKVNL